MCILLKMSPNALVFALPSLENFEKYQLENYLQKLSLLLIVLGMFAVT